MVHIRIIKGREYYYTTVWNKETKAVKNKYLGPVHPTSRAKKKYDVPKIEDSSPQNESEATRTQRLKAILQKLKGSY